VTPGVISIGSCIYGLCLGAPSFTFGVVLIFDKWGVATRMKANYDKFSFFGTTTPAWVYRLLGVFSIMAGVDLVIHFAQQ
jgi:hypothetical protein